MKKLQLLFLLLISYAVSAQVSTGMEQDFDYGLRNLAPQFVSTPVYVCTQGVDGTIGATLPSNIQTEQRVPVNDANYVITGTDSQLIAITAITADRTITLPAASYVGQRIWVTDESGLCSNARRIIVMPAGSDVIGGDSFAVINFPNGSGYLESNGAGKWNIISTTAVQFSAGVNTAPTVTDNGNGSVTIGTGVYALFANTNGVGRPKAYQVAGGTFTLTNLSSNFIYAEYNTTTGVVSLQQTTTETPLNDLTQVLVYAAYRDGTTLHPRNFDTWGVALANKLNRSIYRTQRVRIEEGGIQLGETASPAARTITISAGTMWIGANESTMTALTSAANTCYHVIQTSPGVWTNSTVVTQYNNTQYNTTAGLQTLNNNEYGVNWVYRSIGTDNDMAIVLGSASYTLGQAQTSVKPANLPTFLRHMELIGRIIVLKNATTATQIDLVNQTAFNSAGVTDHNALLNLQTAQAGVTYGHVSDASQTIYGAKTFSDDLSFANGKGFILDNGGINRGGKVYNGSTIDNLTNYTFYPSSGTNVGSSYRIVPKGTGFSSTIKSTIQLFNTDFIADGTNYEFISTTSGGNSFNISTGRNGTGVLRPLLLSSGFGDGATNANQFWLQTDGRVTINTSSNNGIDHLQINGSLFTKVIHQRNVADTFTNNLTNTTTASRTWTLPDATGTVALTNNPTSLTATQFILSALNTAPTTSTDTGTTGEIRIVNGFIYVCVATNTWQRATLSTF